MRTMAAPKTALAPVANEAELTASAAVVAASFVASAAVFAASLTTVHALP